ncbi:hypothetical protein [Flavobacterium limi]|uniref:YcxB-like protein n=1 Tax=Flavobacterium limi TaxID=2045105 RepID=A0ABQ1UNQ5_9FLAO|nr:hypothetical protein [Flavobacterium limi]GGF23448.1 hypothetical protein GCM10011518_35950 [Flavobacterium limi]
MNNQIIKKCIEENELQLSFWDKISHYWSVIFVLIIPICSITYKIIDVINKTERPSRDGEIYLFVIPIIVSVLFYILQKKRLSFKIVETKLNIDEVFKITEETANELGWIINHKTKKYLTANTNPKFTSGSWGEQITLIFIENKILVNSICDLNKKSSLVSMGRNKKNELTFINNIKRASH